MSAHLPCFDKVPARHGKRRPGLLFVARIGDDNRNTVQRADLGQCLEGIYHDDVAAFHILDAGTFRGVALALECLECIIRLEHGIEMTDEQETLSGARFLAAEQVSRPVRLAHVDPLRVEPHCVEFTLHDGADLAHAVMVHRATRDVHGLCDQRDRRFRIRVDPLDHSLLVGIQLARVRYGSQAECQAADLHDFVHRCFSSRWPGTRMCSTMCWIRSGGGAV